MTLAVSDTDVVAAVIRVQLEQLKIVLAGIVITLLILVG